ncbi:hypothetical protein LTR70_004499 [Exophiala xenobiotica]|uniref:Uncharacterized protein n=1 Tax=Lithohypha guttulata TaxID=1690604 RepID=A0ABR0KQS0_9EURO|nr:hypothetical protein LTR24_000429 [Lithohypha guttulata]KAK5320417.1 hypothetical protein LTR70_004499 [Exophiala xenobiotica]
MPMEDDHESQRDFYTPISLMNFSEVPLIAGRRPQPSFALDALDDVAKAFILQRADKAAHDANDVVAYSMLELWVNEQGDDVPGSWISYLEDDQHYHFQHADRAFAKEKERNLGKLGLKSTNCHTLTAANKKVVRKLEKLERQVDEAEKALLISEAVAYSMRHLAQLRANRAGNTS